MAGVDSSELRFARAFLQQRLELRRTHATEVGRGTELVVSGGVGVGVGGLNW